MSGSIGNLFATVSADASQFVAEFNRAENQARRSAGKISTEVEKLTHDVQKKFTASKIGGDFLKGIGLGSSFAVINTVLEKITDRYREQAELAERILRLTERTRNAVEARFRLQRTDEQQLAKLEKERVALQDLLKVDVARGQAQDIIRKGQQEYMKSMPAITLGEFSLSGPGSMPGVAEMKEALRLLGPRLGAEKVEELRAKIEELSLEIEHLSQPMRMAAVNNALTEFFDSLDQGSKDAAEALERNRDDIGRAVSAVDQKLRGDLQVASEAFEKRRKDAAKAAKEFEELDEKFRKLSTPIQPMSIEGLESEIDAIKSRREGADIEGQIDLTEQLIERQRQLNWLYDEQSRKAFEVGATLAGSFENAVFSGGKLREMLAGIGNDLLRLVFRKAITEPLAGSIAGLLSGGGAGIIGKILGFADGGYPPVGKVSVVGERGPELFVPKTAGMIVPNHAISSGGGSGSGGSRTIYIDARGADSAAVARLERLALAQDYAFERRAVSANIRAAARREVR